MSSSGLIYAAIVGAWAAYLVPMWLRRQDELNEGRQTERFTTAIRILSRRGALERRYARMIAEGEEGLTDTSAAPPGQVEPPPEPPASSGPAPESGGRTRRRRDTEPAETPRGRQVHVPLPAEPEAPARAAGNAKRPTSAPSATSRPSAAGPGREPTRPAPAAKASKPANSKGSGRTSTPPDGRAALLARRRRVVAVLFLSFTLGAVVAGLAGLAWLWLPALPGLALSAYIVYLRAQEHRRYEANLRRRLRARVDPSAGRGEHRGASSGSAGERRRTGRAPGGRAGTRPPGGAGHGAAASAATPRPAQAPGDTRPAARPERPRPESARPDVVRRDREEMDHAAWIAELASGTRDRDAWDPVPVPLPTYVTAPVVPRGDDLGEDPQPVAPAAEVDHERAEPDSPRVVPPTPLFDQYADDVRQGFGASVDRLPTYETEWRRAGNE